MVALAAVGEVGEGRHRVIRLVAGLECRAGIIDLAGLEQLLALPKQLLGFRR